MTTTPAHVNVSTWQDLRDALELFLVTVRLTPETMKTLDWVIPDFCSIVSEASFLSRANAVVEAYDGKTWDFAVIIRARQGLTIELALAFRAGKLGIWYRMNRAQRIVVAYPGFYAGKDQYSMFWLQRSERLTLNRDKTKQAISRSITGALSKLNRQT